MVEIYTLGKILMQDHNEHVSVASAGGWQASVPMSSAPPQIPTGILHARHSSPPKSPPPTLNPISQYVTLPPPGPVERRGIPSQKLSDSPRIARPPIPSLSPGLSRTRAMGQERSSPSTLEDRSLRAVANLIKERNARRVVVLTGAGISTSAGSETPS